MTSWSVCNASALDWLAGLEPGSVAAIVTDPPYGTTDGRGKRTMSVDDGGSRFGFAWDKALPVDWLSAAFAALRPGGSLMAFTNNLRTGVLWDAAEVVAEVVGFRGRQTFVWVKPDGGATPRPNFTSAYESGIFLVKPGAPTWNGGGAQVNVIQSRRAHSEIDGRTVFHPTQKPIAVMRWLVELVTNAGDLVVDPFCGSGSTGVAAVRAGRRFAGCDISPDFVAVARRRLECAAADAPEPVNVGQIGLFEVKDAT